jgi:hypothetical protein
MSMDYKEKTKQLTAILDQIIETFKIAQDTQYLQRFKYFRGNCEYVGNQEDAKELARNIMHSYGGMGSFNDFVLYTNGKYLLEPDEEFDRLRTKLFNICVDMITKPREGEKAVV